MLDLGFAGALTHGSSDAQWTRQRAHATDRLAGNAGTVATLRGLTPLAARAWWLALRTRR